MTTRRSPHSDASAVVAPALVLLVFQLVFIGCVLPPPKKLVHIPHVDAPAPAAHESVVAAKNRVMVIHFETGSAEIGPDQDALIELARPVVARALSIVIEGHADLRGAGGYNRALSAARANAVADRLRALAGMAGAPPLPAAGLGQERPLCRENKSWCHAINRRVEISMVADTVDTE